MVKILVVDDESIKSRAIKKVLNEYKDINVENVPSTDEALCSMRKTTYDMIIIDIVLPEKADDINPTKNGGLSLIKDIKNTFSIKKPKFIICITSNKETFETAEHELANDLIPLVYFDLKEEKWVNQIKSSVTYLLDLDSQVRIASIDTAIVTAVNDEFEALKREFDKTVKLEIPNDPSNYFICDYLVNESKKRTIIVKLPEMGMTAASNTTTKIINQFNPKKIFMVGICGGISGEVKLGDLVIASSSWDYGSGKIKPKQNKDKNYYTFEPAPNMISINANIKDKMDNLSKDILDEVANQWNMENKHDTITPDIHIAPLPSGSSVISDPELFNEIIKPQNRKCAGIDMETYGVYYAVKHTTTKTIDFLSIKAVSDFADSEKNDNYHEKCCFLSARFLKQCLEKGVL